jgi:outer membrane lipoprotein-sorting protein
MRGVVLGLALLLLGGCQGRILSPFATPPKVGQTFKGPEPLLKALVQRRGTLAALKARARFTLRTSDQELVADHVVVLSGPSSLRLETLSPVGQPTSLLVAKGDRIRWVDPVGGRHWDGLASRGTLERLTGVPLAPAEMVAILAGALPVGSEEASPLMEGQTQDGTYQLLLTADQQTEKVIVASSDLTILSRTRYTAGGKEALRVVYGRFRHISDYPVPLTIEVELPQKDYHLRVDYQKVLVNQEVDEELFELPIPPGSKKVTLD